jgi:hypothetical protein
VARFDRAIDPSILALLEPGGWLAPLVLPWSVRAGGQVLGTHLQLREGRRVVLYCGSSILLDVAVSPTHARFVATARGSNPATLFRTWSRGEPGLVDAIRSYLAGVDVRVVKEGLVQASWHAATAPWSTFDHEAAFGYASVADREQALDLPALAEAEAAVAARVAADEPRWSALPVRPVRNNRDQLAVDAAGRLVVVELKHAQSGAGLYFGPLQLLRYLHEDAARLDDLLPALQRLLEQKRRMTLVAPGPDLCRPVRPVLAWGEGMPSPEVQRRTRLVLEAANHHLPAETRPIEVWHQPGGRPVRWA